MKQITWFDLFSEEMFQKLLLYALLPVLAAGFIYIRVSGYNRENRTSLPFRVARGIPTNSIIAFKKAGPAVVLIETFDKDNRLVGKGTGFFIDNSGGLITNHHVIRGVHIAVVKTTDGNTYPVKGIIAKDTNADIVKLEVDVNGKDFSFLEPAKIMPSWGERTVVLGHPNGFELTLSEGLVNAGDGDGKISDECIMFEISAPVSPGSSGSPVLDPNGQVIGVVRACKIAAPYDESDSGVTYAVAISNIQNLKPEKKLMNLDEYTASTAPLFTYSPLYPENHIYDARSHSRGASQSDGLPPGF